MPLSPLYKIKVDKIFFSLSFWGCIKFGRNNFNKSIFLHCFSQLIVTNSWSIITFIFSISIYAHAQYSYTLRNISTLCISICYCNYFKNKPCYYYNARIMKIVMKCESDWIQAFESCGNLAFRYTLKRSVFFSTFSCYNDELSERCSLMFLQLNARVRDAVFSNIHKRRWLIMVLPNIFLWIIFASLFWTLV